MRGRPNRVATRPAGHAAVPEHPDGMSCRPEGRRSAMSTDVLSDVLRAVRADRSHLLRLQSHRSVGSGGAAVAGVAPIVMPAPARDRIPPCGPQARLGTRRRLRRRCGCVGDLLIFPQGDAHVLSSAPGVRAAPDLAMYARTSTPCRSCTSLAAAAPIAHRRLRIPWFRRAAVTRSSAALPSVIHLAAGDPEAGRRPSELLLDCVVRESGRGNPGTQNVLSRLSELIFVEAIRAAPADAAGGRPARSPAARPPSSGARWKPCTPRHAIHGRRKSRPYGGRIPFGAGGTVRRDGRPSSDALPGALANAARISLAARGAACRCRRASEWDKNPNRRSAGCSRS